MLSMKSYLGWEIDFTKPQGEPAFIGPDSVSWRIFKNPIALAIGGVAAVLLEFADPRIRSGVWEHSRFKSDPMGRSMRTGMAALIGIYGPKSAANNVIWEVTQMHGKVVGTTPGGLAYRALDPDLLNWVSGTAAYGFLTAYDRFIHPVSEEEKIKFHLEGLPISRAYGVTNPIDSPANFDAELVRRMPGFEAHPIIKEFLAIVKSGKAVKFIPRSMQFALANASVAILPAPVRDKLELGSEYDLSPLSEQIIKLAGALAERIPLRFAPPAQACRRLGLPSNFLYKSRQQQDRLLQKHAHTTGEDNTVSKGQ